MKTVHVKFNKIAREFKTLAIIITIIIVITLLISSKRLFSIIYNAKYLKLSFPKIPLENAVLFSDRLKLVWNTIPQLLAS